jgi:hypothetical protein
MRNQMKLALAALILFASAMPAEAKPGRYSSNRGWAEEEKCFKNEYREEYIPGTSKRPGRVKTYRNRVQVPCRGGRYVPNYAPHPRYEEQYPNLGRHDDNSCIEGSILGGIAGGGAGAALSRKDGRLWAIPLGIVTGSMLGCQVDGG